MLQDKYLPAYHFNEVHSIRINRPPSRVMAIVERLDFSKSRVIRFLFALRGMPARMMTIEGLERGRFIQLERNQNEMIIGLVGQFWKPSGNLQVFQPHEFVPFNKKGFLKAVWSFQIAGDDRTSLLTTETRIQCLGDSARRRFRLYWFFIRPFSGLIRIEMLRAIRMKAEEVS